MIMIVSPQQYQYLLLRTTGEDLAGTLSYIQNTLKNKFPDLPFEYTFLDQEFDAQYRSEQNVGRLFFLFSFIAIIIACMGLFGVFSFITLQRTKEIGIRKVLGSSVPMIVYILVRDILILILISAAIVIPLVYIVLKNWLQNFAYRTPLSIWIFVAAIVMALSMAMLTITYQAVKSALANPIVSLRYE